MSVGRPEKKSHIYGADGESFGFAECQQTAGFFDLAKARLSAKRRQRTLKAEKQLLEAHMSVPIEEIDARRVARAPAAPAAIEAKVVTPYFVSKRGRSEARTNSYRPGLQTAPEAAQEAMKVALQSQQKPDAPVGSSLPGTREDRFAWTQPVLDGSEAGDRIGTEDAREPREYMKSAEYQAQLRMFEAFGEDGVG